MAEVGDHDSPRSFEVQRIETHPRPYNEAGRIGLLRVVRVVPPPNPNPLLLRQLQIRLGVSIARINALDDAATGFADYDIRAPGRGMDAWQRVEGGVDGFAAFLNAGQDIGAYVEAMFG